MINIINLDYGSKLPIYEQIVNEIESYVLLGVLKEGEQMPSIRELATTLGINPNTVKKAYDILESKKIIMSISTKGTFINSSVSNIKEEKINKEISLIKEQINNLTKLGISYEEIIERLK